MDEYAKKILKFELGMIIGSIINLLWLDLGGVITVFILVNLGYLGRIITESDWSVETSKDKCTLPNIKKAERSVCIYSGSCFCRREDGTCGSEDLCQFKD